MYPRKFHGIGPFDPETGEILNKSTSDSYSKIFGDTLSTIADKDEKIVAIAAAMGTATGLTPFYENHEERYFDVGIAEEHAVTFAAGLAKAGYKPVVAIYSSFLQRAIDYIIEDIALQDLHVVFAVDRAGLVGADGETHHGQFDLSYMSMIPGMTVLAPADGKQLSEMINYAVGMEGPVSVRYPRGSAKGEHPELEHFCGKNIVVRKGSDVNILAVGAMLDEALKAADILEKSGISAAVTNVAVVKPLDEHWHDISSKLVVTLEDNVIRGGFGESFSSAYANSSFDILSIGIPDKFVSHGTVAQLRKECRMDADSIAERIMEYLERKA